MKKILCLVLAFALVFTLAATVASADDTKHWKFSVISGEGVGHVEGMYEFCRVLEELSGGSIQIDTYINGTLYGQDAATEAVISGDLELNLTTTGWVGTYYEPLQMFSRAYNFSSYDHYYAFTMSDMYQDLLDDVNANAPVHMVGWWYNGARVLNPCFEEPVMTPEDMAGKTLRTRNTEADIAAGEALGGIPTPLAFGELYTALQNGLVDAEENPLSQIQASNFNEVTKQICLTYHNIEVVPLIVNKDLWESLTEEEQGWIEEAWEAGRKVCDQFNLDAEAELVDYFKNDCGMVVTYPDVEAFSTYANEYYLSHPELTASWDMDLFEAVANMEY